MSSNGWRTLFEKDWAGCVVHNLPFFDNAPKKTVKKQSTISICGQSAATWNWYDFMEKSGAKNISRS